MTPSNFTVTTLLAAIILAAAGAPLLVLYGLCGVAMLWQLLVALAAAGGPPADPEFLVDDDGSRD